MTIILDMGGVLMQHNMPECIARFSRILGEEQMEHILGMKPNAEGIPDSLMVSTKISLTRGTPCMQVFLPIDWT